MYGRRKLTKTVDEDISREEGRERWALYTSFLGADCSQAEGKLAEAYFGSVEVVLDALLPLFA